MIKRNEKKKKKKKTANSVWVIMNLNGKLEIRKRAIYIKLFF